MRNRETDRQLGAALELMRAEVEREEREEPADFAPDRFSFNPADIVDCMSDEERDSYRAMAEFYAASQVAHTAARKARSTRKQEQAEARAVLAEERKEEQRKEEEQRAATAAGRNRIYNEKRAADYRAARSAHDWATVSDMEIASNFGMFYVTCRNAIARKYSRGMRGQDHVSQTVDKFGHESETIEHTWFTPNAKNNSRQYSKPKLDAQGRADSDRITRLGRVASDRMPAYDREDSQGYDRQAFNQAIAEDTQELVAVLWLELRERERRSYYVNRFGYLSTWRMLAASRAASVVLGRVQFSGVSEGTGNYDRAESVDSVLAGESYAFDTRPAKPELDEIDVQDTIDCWRRRIWHVYGNTGYAASLQWTLSGMIGLATVAELMEGGRYVDEETGLQWRIPARSRETILKYMRRIRSIVSGDLPELKGETLQESQGPPVIAKRRKKKSKPTRDILVIRPWRTLATRYHDIVDVYNIHDRLDTGHVSGYRMRFRDSSVVVGPSQDVSQASKPKVFNPPVSWLPISHTSYRDVVSIMDENGKLLTMERVT